MAPQRSAYWAPGNDPRNPYCIFKQPTGMTYDQYLAGLAPLGWWKLDDASGSSAAADSSGNGYTGTVNGGVTFQESGPPMGGNSALFDGSTGYVSLPLPSIPSQPGYTLLAWFNAPSQTHGGILVYGPSTGYAIGLGASDFDTTGDYAFGENAFVSWLDAGTEAYSLGTWHMLALTVGAAGAFELYLDGASFATGTSGASGASGTFAIGSDQSNSTRYVGAYLAQAAVLDRVLTSTEVSALYTKATA